MQKQKDKATKPIILGYGEDSLTLIFLQKPGKRMELSKGINNAWKLTGKSKISLKQESCLIFYRPSFARGINGLGEPDFIILDLLLPKVDGFDILNELKKDKETANLPVFIFTNLSDEDSKEKGLNLNVAHYFIKSDFSIDDFVEKIIKIIKNREKME